MGSGHWEGNAFRRASQALGFLVQPLKETNVIDEIATSSGGSLASMYSSTLPMAERATPMYFAESYTNFRLWAPGLRASG